MTDRWPEIFRTSLAGSAPPPHWPAPLAALWWLALDRSGPASAAWERAHALVQDASGPEAAWVHAHLHRIEGDADNAHYWYARAGREPAEDELADERILIAATLLAGL